MHQFCEGLAAAFHEACRPRPKVEDPADPGHDLVCHIHRLPRLPFRVQREDGGHGDPYRLVRQPESRMGVSFDAEFRTVLPETFGATADKAWAENCLRPDHDSPPERARAEQRALIFVSDLLFQVMCFRLTNHSASDICSSELGGIQ